MKSHFENNEKDFQNFSKNMEKLWGNPEIESVWKSGNHVVEFTGRKGQKPSKLILLSAENLDANRADVVNEEDKSKRAVTPTPPSSIAGNFAWHTCRKLIYVPRSAQKGYSVGHWPIPESFWPDLNSPMLVGSIFLI